MQPSTISIALCTYNAEKYLSILLDSILKQTLLPTEIVVCDDGSTDATKNILFAYKEKNQSLFQLHFNTTNIGYIKNFEQCICLCSGNYVAIADHDDIWRPDKLQKLYEGIKDALLVYSNSQFMAADGTILERQLTTQYHFFSNPKPTSFIFSNCVWGHTCMIKKELANFAFPIPTNAPYDIWLGFIAANVSKLNYVDECLTMWRQHDASFSIKHFSTQSKQNKELANWKNKLAWMDILQTTHHCTILPFIKELQTLYKKKQLGYSVSLLLFLIKHRNVLFAFWRKSPLSLLNECRKLARKV